jgi:hypothetical protein
VKDFTALPVVIRKAETMCGFERQSESGSLMLEGEDFSQTGKGSITTLCAWCGRIKRTEGEWESPVGMELDSNTTHGICPECIASEMCASNDD